jgi:hypothetical protein
MTASTRIQRLAPRRLVLIAVFLAISLSLSLLGPSPEPTQNLRPTPQTPAERTIETGLFVKNIYNLSLANRTFSADGWFWLLWPQTVQNILERNHIPITELAELPNDAQGFRQHLEPDTQEPEPQPDGRLLQVYRFSGTFYDETLALRNFPFLHLDLPITIEARPDQLSFAKEAIAIQNRQPTNNAVEHSLFLHGYEFQGVDVKRNIHFYPTSFGELDARRLGEYSQVTFNLNFRSNNWAAFNNFILPWTLVMATLILAPSLDGQLFAQRLAIPPTALLTLVFLQQGAHEGLPMLGYLTYLDKLYLFGFIASTIQLGLFVWGSNLINCANTDQRDGVNWRINGIDRAYQLATILGCLCILTLGLNRA